MAVFADLPVEIRLQIWELCALPEQAVFLWGKPVRPWPQPLEQHARHFHPQVAHPRPPALNTCAESRAYLLSPAIAARYHIGQTHRPLDPALDVLLLPSPAHMRQVSNAIYLATRYGNPDPWPARFVRLALSPECMDDDDDDDDDHADTAFVGVEGERRGLFETLLADRLRPRRLRDISLVVATVVAPGRADGGGGGGGGGGNGGGAIDLESEARLVVLRDWSGAGASSRYLKDVDKMRARLASELQWTDQIYKLVRGEDPIDRPTITVKRLARVGEVEAGQVRDWWKGHALADRLIELARRWKGTGAGAGG
ncbi:unnamed protein product [Discula destructiva]